MIVGMVAHRYMSRLTLNNKQLAANEQLGYQTNNKLKS